MRGELKKFSDIDFKGGNVSLCCEAPEEDMLVVEYANGITLYVGFTNRFIVEVIKDGEHSVPFAQAVTDSRREMYETVKRAVTLASVESARCRSNYGGLWETRMI